MRMHAFKKTGKLGDSTMLVIAIDPHCALQLLSSCPFPTDESVHFEFVESFDLFDERIIRIDPVATLIERM